MIRPNLVRIERSTRPFAGLAEIDRALFDREVTNGGEEGLFVSLQLPLSPMGLFPLGIEHPLDMTVQRLHDPDPRHHRRTASRHQHQYLDRRLPFVALLVGLRKVGDVLARVHQRD
jgi:hypothetical protein